MKRAILFVLMPMAATAAWPQATGTGGPVGVSGQSTINQLQRSRDAVRQAQGTLGTMIFKYQTSSQTFTSSWRKTPVPTGTVRNTAEVREAESSTRSRGVRLAMTPKSKEANDVPSGWFRFKAIRTRGGLDQSGVCTVDPLSSGFFEMVITPFGGKSGRDDGIACHFYPMQLLAEDLDPWIARVRASENGDALQKCIDIHRSQGGPFWACVDTAGIQFPDLPAPAKTKRKVK
ncbi:MAG: hypothetical protein AAF657_06315 [Acidobacteriota bacterium]